MAGFPGQPTGFFGQPTNDPSMFGQPTNDPSMFGQPTNDPSTFGQTTTYGPYGPAPYGTFTNGPHAQMPYAQYTFQTTTYVPRQPGTTYFWPDDMDPEEIAKMTPEEIERIQVELDKLYADLHRPPTSLKETPFDDPDWLKPLDTIGKQFGTVYESVFNDLMEPVTVYWLLPGKAHGSYVPPVTPYPQPVPTPGPMGTVHPPYGWHYEDEPTEVPPIEVGRQILNPHQRARIEQTVATMHHICISYNFDPKQMGHWVTECNTRWMPCGPQGDFHEYNVSTLTGQPFSRFWDFMRYPDDPSRQVEWAQHFPSHEPCPTAPGPADMMPHPADPEYLAKMHWCGGRPYNPVSYGPYTRQPPTTTFPSTQFGVQLTAVQASQAYTVGRLSDSDNVVYMSVVCLALVTQYFLVFGLKKFCNRYWCSLRKLVCFKQPFLEGDP